MAYGSIDLTSKSQYENVRKTNPNFQVSKVLFRRLSNNYDGQLVLKCFRGPLNEQVRFSNRKAQGLQFPQYH